MIRLNVIFLIAYHVGTSMAGIQKGSWHEVDLFDGLEETSWKSPEPTVEVQCANSASIASSNIYCHHRNGTCYHVPPSVPHRMGAVGDGSTCKKLGDVFVCPMIIFSCTVQK